MRTRLGIVGAGLIWDHSHRDNLMALDNSFEIVAFAVRSEQTRTKVRREFPDSTVFTDYRQMLERDDIDAVVVLTPLHLNAAVAMAALRAGKHALVEKPLATSGEEIAEIIRLEGETHRKVLVLEQFRYDDRLEMLKRILDEGRIGDLVSYEVVNHTKIDQDKYNPRGYGKTEWRINPEFPLGSLFDAGIHTITRLTYLFSPPDSAYALGSSVRPDFGEYDHVLVAFAHPGGVNGTLSYASYLDDGNNYLFVRGTTGTISFRADGLEITGEAAGSVTFPDSDCSLEMWRQCAAWFANSDTPVYGARESAVDVATLVAVDTSIREGRKVLLK